MFVDKPFDSSAFFAGGSGMFIEFHDIIKPVYLYAVIKMIITKESHGLPIDIIKDFSVLSLVEWYHNRRDINPLYQLDWQHKIQHSALDDLLKSLLNDESVYSLAPGLNISRMVSVYRQQHMVFPWYIYSEEFESGIQNTIPDIFHGINCTYVHGDLKQAISKCGQNYTYIFSDIEKVKMVSELLQGTCNHILVARDYRYNYTDSFKTMKYDLAQLMDTHKYLRIDSITAMDPAYMRHAFDNVCGIIH